MNHYEALGVAVGAGPAQVRRAYLDAARRHHPDFHASADERTRAHHAQQMQVVNQAWAVLGDVSRRASYDRSLREGSGAVEATRSRSARSPQVPEGKGWTPRRDDDAWQADFRSWADQDERLAPDAPGARRHRGALAVLPVAMFGLAVVAIALGVVLTARPLVALGFASLAISATLFVMLPIFEMSRGRHRD